MLIKRHFVGMTVACIFSVSAATVYTGKVIEKGGSKPVNGVLVSLGHSQYRTRTDNEGEFRLNTDESNVFKMNNKSNPVRVFWNSRTGLLDLISSNSAIERVSIFDLTGRVAFQSVITPDIKRIKVPSLSRGIYLLQLASKTGDRHNFKINTGGISALLSFDENYATKKQLMISKPVSILFRHDDYYPVDNEVVSTGQELMISMEKDPRSALFSQNRIYSFNFTVTAADSLKMEAEVHKEKYIPAELSFEGQSFGKVGLRYKGSSYSLGNCFDSSGNRYDKKECQKISLKVKFNKFTDSLRLFQMKELNLHSMFSDGSKMRDMIAYRMYRDMGIYSPRTSYAKVYINDVLQGVFVVVEAVDGRFTKSRWPESGNGNLYKEAWPWVGDTAYYDSMLATNKDPEDSADVSAMVDLYNAINSSTAETFIDNVSSFIDFDYLIRYMVVDRAIKNWDGITGWYSVPNWLGNHNFFFYEEENTDGKIWIIPWDLDNTFQRSDPFIDDAGIANWNEKAESCEPVPVFTGSSFVIPSSCDKFISLTAANCWDKFVKTGDELLRWIYVKESINKRIDSYSQLLDTIIKQDPHLGYKIWQNEASILKKNITSLHSRFYEYIHQVADTVDTTDYSKPFEGDGKIVIDRTNNFEFTPQGEAFPFKSILASDQVEADLVHSTINPIWGTADLKLSFTFNPIIDDQSYSEWINLRLKSGKKYDIQNCKEIRVNLCADKQRYVWVGLYNANDYQYGWAIYVNKEQKVYSLRIDEISYPLWDDSGDPDRLDYVLKYCTGIFFSPSAAFDSMGELLSPDSGFMRIDNIKFVF